MVHLKLCHPVCDRVSHLGTCRNKRRLYGGLSVLSISLEEYAHLRSCIKQQYSYCEVATVSQGLRVCLCVIIGNSILGWCALLEHGKGGHTTEGALGHNHSAIQQPEHSVIGCITNSYLSVVGDVLPEGGQCGFENVRRAGQDRVHDRSPTR